MTASHPSLLLWGAVTSGTHRLVGRGCVVVMVTHRLTLSAHRHHPALVLKSTAEVRGSDTDTAAGSYLGCGWSGAYFGGGPIVSCWAVADTRLFQEGGGQ